MEYKIGDIIFPDLTRNCPVVKMIKNIQEENYIYSSKIIFIRVNPNMYNAEFLRNILNSEKYNKDILEKVYRKLKRITFRENIGNDLYQISINNLRKFEIPEISLDEQKYILRQEMKINKKIQEFEKKKQELYNI